MARQVTRTYDPDRYIVTVNGRIFNGFASGDAIKATRQGEHFSKQTGLQGAVTRSRKHVPGGTIELTLQQTAPENKILSDHLATDLNTLQNLLSVQIKDMSGESVAFTEDGWIMTEPEMTVGEDAGSRTWIIDCGHLKIVHGEGIVASAT